MPGPDSGCKTFRPTATPTVSRLIRSTITSTCRCPRVVPIAKPSPPMVAWASMPRSNISGGLRPALLRGRNLSDQRLLVAHHFPVPAALGPQFADEDSSETQRRAFRELHAALIGDESIVRPERLNLEKLQKIIGVHAVLDFT